MECGCSCSDEPRFFLTREEKIEKLKTYRDALEKESKGVTEKIKDLEKAK